MKLKKGWIKRKFISPWEPKPGDFIILNPDETRLFISKIPQDINTDGFKEEVLEKDEWIDMDGSDTLIDPELPGTLWNAEFKIKNENY